MTKKEFERQWNQRYPIDHVLMLKIGKKNSRINLYATNYSFSQNNKRISIYFKFEYIGSIPFSLIMEVV